MARVNTSNPARWLAEHGRAAGLLAAALLAVGAVPAVMAAVAPSPAPMYGCLMPDRSLQHNYTNPDNFAAYLDANGGRCPGGGSPYGIGYTPPTAASPAAYTCTSTAQCPAAAGGYSDGLPAAWTQGGTVQDDVGTTPITFSASGNGNWQATETVPAGNGCSVASYPADQANTYPTRPDGSYPPSDWTGYATFTMTYATQQPSRPGGCWEWAGDFWMQPPGSVPWIGPRQEVMVWTYDNGAAPAGSDTGADWTDPASGDSYDIWSGFGGDTISLVRHGNAAAGRVDLKALFGFLHAGYGIYTGIVQANFGIEVRSTGGAAMTWKVTALSWAVS